MLAGGTKDKEHAMSQKLDTSIGAVETHASENLILHDSEICDYSDRLLAAAR